MKPGGFYCPARHFSCRTSPCCPLYTRMYRLLHPDVKNGNMGVLRNYVLVSAEKRGLLWNEEPYFANLISIVPVFTFVCSIVLYAF